MLLLCLTQTKAWNRHWNGHTQTQWQIITLQVISHWYISYCLRFDKPLRARDLVSLGVYSPVAIATLSLWDPQKPIIFCRLYICPTEVCLSFSLTHSTHTAQHVTQPSHSVAGPLSFYWTFIERKIKTFYIWKIDMWNVSTQTILFHIKKLNLIIIVPLLLSVYISLHVSFPARGPLTCSWAWSRMRWRMWGWRKKLHLQSWKMSALAACTSGKEMRMGNNGARETKEQAQQISLGREWVRVWSVCSSHLSHGTTGRALQMGNNCLRVWVHLWVFAGTSVRKKKQSEKGRRTKKRTSVHWFEQNRFMCSCILWLTT